MSLSVHPHRKPRRKVLKIVKWAGTVVTGILIALTACIAPCVFHWQARNGWHVGFMPFCIQFGRTSSSAINPVGWSGWFIAERWTPILRFEFNTEDRYWATSLSGVLSGTQTPIPGTSYWYMRIPTYALIAPVLLVTCFAWRRDLIASKRSREGSCSKCGYDLSATPIGTKCPECGARAKDPASPG